MQATIKPERRHDGVQRWRLTLYLRRSHERKGRRYREGFASAAEAEERRRVLLKVAREKGMDGVCELIWGAAPPTTGPADGLLALARRFVTEKEEAGKRLRTVGNLKHRLKLLTSQVGDLPAHLVTLEDLKHALREVPGGARNKVNAAIAWRNFFRWMWREGVVRDQDLVARLQLPTVRSTLPKVADAWRVARLVAAAWYEGGTRARPGEMLAYVLATFFSPVRPEEFQRITDWGMVNLEAGLLPLDEQVTKVAMIRNARLRPELVRIFRELKRRRMAPGFFSRRKFRRIKERAGFGRGALWAMDLGRHTYASNTYALTNDEATLSADMGNSVAVLRKFYLNRLVTVPQAQQWCAVLATVAAKLQGAGGRRKQAGARRAARNGRR